MNYQEQLLKNYILSEVYNIEKSLLLKEKNCLLKEGLLVEGKVWDWTKNTFSKVKDIFRLNPKERRSFEESIKEAERAGNLKKANRLKEIQESIETKKFKNQSILILSMIAVMMFNHTGNFNKVEEAVEEGSRIIDTRGSDKEKQENIVDYLKRKGVDVRYIGTGDNTNYQGDRRQEDSRENQLVKLFIKMIEESGETVSIEGRDGTIKSELLEEYFIWEEDNPRPNNTSMNDHFQEFLDAKIQVLMDKLNKKESERIAARNAKKQIEDKNIGSLLGDENFSKIDLFEFNDLNQQEKEEYIDNIIECLEDEDFVFRYTEDLKNNEGTSWDHPHTQLRIHLLNVYNKSGNQEIRKHLDDMSDLPLLVDMIKSGSSEEQVRAMMSDHSEDSPAIRFIDDHYNN